MKRLLIAFLVSLVLMMTVGTSVALAKGPPESIIVNAGSGNKPVFDVGSRDEVPPPEITIILDNGKVIQPSPPDKTDPDEPPPDDGL